MRARLPALSLSFALASCAFLSGCASMLRLPECEANPAQSLLDEMNEVRAREGVPPLRPDVLLAEAHALAAKPELTPQDLAGQPMVLLNAPPSGDYFLSLLTDKGVEPQVAYRSASFEMVRGMVGHGLGYALLATKPASGMTYDGCALVTRPLLSDTGPSRVVLAYRRGARLSKPAEEFAWLCRDFFGIDLH